ncbi:MAG TPA: glucose-6-phosphate dehydrogenase [Elusimicrobiota bacterium]|nr:glucose-6-phosphate dehydrogenase [Elusimicrobiota bacterium]
MVVFGALGDLSRRKLLPALYYLRTQGLLPERFAVVGFARRGLDDAGFRRYAREELERFAQELDSRAADELVSGFFYQRGDFGDEGSFRALGARLEALARERGTGANALFYLATDPVFFADIARRAARAGLAAQDAGWRRFVVEKPFGRDLASAEALNAALLSVIKEEQIYRIDHYLGKETVQNLLVLRFANGIFEPVWDRRYVDHVQITVAEELGVERRGSYYERSGALRDMVPSHMFQLLTLTAMEPPASFAADAVRDEQAKVLRALQPLGAEELRRGVVRGQYGAGTVAGKAVPGYRQEPDVAPDSSTETFVALETRVDNWRWAGVPFFLRTGKRLARRGTELVIQFKRVPHVLFRDAQAERLPANQLVVRIQPNEGISLRFQAKVPGPSMRPGTVGMDFRYHDYFGERPNTGYERLLRDVMLGDATHFKRADMVEAAWSYLAPIQELWSARRPQDFPNYPAGSWGPAEADALLGARHRRWLDCAG